MILTILLLIISASAYSIKETLQFHFWTSVFKKLPVQWWCPSISWVNKYKEIITTTENTERPGTVKEKISYSTEPRFFGSTTFFVFVTDAYHLFQFIFLNTLFLAFAINIESYPWYLNFIGLRLIYGIVWWVLFENVLIKK